MKQGFENLDLGTWIGECVVGSLFWEPGTDGEPGCGIWLGEPGLGTWIAEHGKLKN